MDVTVVVGRCSVGAVQKPAKSELKGSCVACKEYGHKKAECPRLKNGGDVDEYVFSATAGELPDDVMWQLDSRASSHMSGGRADFAEFRELGSPIAIKITTGQRLRAAGFSW
ncbi:hypothetical protein PI124_g15546 [Phytophthora idaei]|nr:hypothetical protein PI125_g15519 [Phytophthora idaei]KAG3143618.1 hypothetical protein PI126_g14533 [Phytophthora idaei]KAG3239526.1 hypothetical protein PI124_g15546 [Phytophthora idaei]